MKKEAGLKTMEKETTREKTEVFDNFRRFVEAHPEHLLEPDVQTGMLPIHLALSRVGNSDWRERDIAFLVSACKESLTVVDNKGCLPLHHAARSRLLSSHVFRLIILGHPKAIYVKNKGGEYPMLCAIRRRQKSNLEELLRHHRPEDEVLKSPLLHLLFCHPPFNTFVRQACATLISASPCLLSARNWRSNLPLHIAVLRQMDPELVSTLIERSPGACGFQNVAGQLPIHIVAGHERESPLTLQLIAATYPDGVFLRDKGGDLPIHIAVAQQRHPSRVNDPCVYLCENYPSCLTELNGAGATPLLLHVSSPHVNCELLHCLLSANPAAARCPAVSGDLPVHCFAFPLHAGNNGNSDRTRGLEELIAAYPESLQMPGVGNQLPLHRMLARKWINGALTILQSYPGASRYVDSTGCLPIHVACRYPPYHRECSLLMKQLVNANPSSLQAYDDRGYLPIHHASENMKDSVLFRELLEFYAFLPQSKHGNETLFLACEARSDLSVIFLLVHRSLDLFSPQI